MLVEKKENLRISGISNILDYFEHDHQNKDILKWIHHSFRQDNPDHLNFIKNHYNDSISLKNLYIYRLLKKSHFELTNDTYDKANKTTEQDLASIEKNCSQSVEPPKPVKTPLIVAVESGARIGEPNHAWHGRAEFAELALPTAVRRVLDQSLRLFGT